MSYSVLVAYATRYGTTREAAEIIAAVLVENGFTVDIKPAREIRSLAGYQAVVLGAPLYMFHWHPDALRLLSRQRAALKERPAAVFALGPTHDPYDESEWQASRAQLDKELNDFPWFKPLALELFGGVYDPAKLRFPIKWFIGKEPASDRRDPAALRAWAVSLGDKFRSALS